jgi:hypothetical protein
MNYFFENFFLYYYRRLKSSYASIPYISTISLIVVNALPLIGVLLWNWRIGAVMILFWLENIVIGIFNIVRMLTVAFYKSEYRLPTLFLVPFFTVHYGIFCAVHGVFVFLLFGGDLQSSGWGNSNISVHTLSSFFRLAGMHTAILGLLVSHAISFIWNFLGRQEFRDTSPDELMKQPYSRIVLLQITILAGGFLVMASGNRLIPLLILVLLKISLDLRSHFIERVFLGRISLTGENN